MPVICLVFRRERAEHWPYVYGIRLNAADIPDELWDAISRDFSTYDIFQSKHYLCEIPIEW